MIVYEKTFISNVFVTRLYYGQSVLSGDFKNIYMPTYRVAQNGMPTYKSRSAKILPSSTLD